MSQFPPNQTSRFAQLVHRPGGVTIEEAVQASNENLGSIRDNVIAEIDASLERMRRIVVDLDDHPADKALSELYTLSNRVSGMAGVFGMECLGQVSLSLCELLDRMKELERWDGAAVRIHTAALRHVRREEAADETSNIAIVAALKQVLNRIQYPQPAPDPRPAATAAG